MKNRKYPINTPIIFKKMSSISTERISKNCRNSIKRVTKTPRIIVLLALNFLNTMGRKKPKGESIKRFPKLLYNPYKIPWSNTAIILFNGIKFTVESPTPNQITSVFSKRVPLMGNHETPGRTVILKRMTRYIMKRKVGRWTMTPPSSTRKLSPFL